MKEQTTKWIIDPAMDLPLAIIEDTKDGDGVCEMDERTKDNIQRAHLIAAAPDMYEALKEAREELMECGYFDDSIIIKRIDVALAKANPQ